MSKITKQRDGLWEMDGGHGARVSIGDPSGVKVSPRVHAEKWARDVAPDVAAEKLKMIKGVDALEIETVRTHKGGKKKGEIHRLLAGSTEWDIYWPAVKDMPRDEGWAGGVRYYRIVFSVDQSPGTVWHPQPALTQAEIDLGFFRPDNVVNSYSIYGPISGNYLRRDGTLIEARETGKLAHYYRSKFTVQNGDWTWCLDVLDTATATMNVLIPADFVDAADQNGSGELDPTFGYTTAGGTRGQVVVDQLDATGPFTGAAGTITSISAYIAEQSTSSRVTFGLYTDSGGAPSSRVVDTAEVNPGTVGWHTSNTDTAAAITATSYWLAIHCGGQQTDLYFDSGAPASGKYIKYRTGVTYVAGETPASFGAPSSLTDYVRSLYATYTAAAAGHPAIKRFGGVPFAGRPNTQGIHVW
jgi:hypothetical protein